MKKKRELEYQRKMDDEDNPSYKMFAILQYIDNSPYPDVPYLELSQDRRSPVTHRMNKKDMKNFIKFLEKCINEIS